ncbi:MAG: (E)-4-hydroxy-3-methylbut-2-enyl-diphosphate synthase [Verrucomicrobia bacterium]|nr:(E)-4-hydroxy-3-methylbut-2-enyl-diphosphate synthase [Verrucomicrobiota bacterium]
MNILPRYCESPFHYERRKTREVKVGPIGIGGDNPIRIQSMTTSDTKNTEATVREVLDIVKAGCEIVRITAPTVDDANNLRNIRDELRKRGCNAPLVADIHFLPKAAMAAVEFVEKIRVNPGNYADKKKFAVREYTDAQYQEEIERIEAAFTPLVLRCKELGRAMRIGTNHGSLSDRIMNRYGDTPLGMVESALEFVRICGKNDFHQIVLSMKASNPRVMIQAYRLLASRLGELGLDYPFHLGVTEAGDGEDGRIKSAIGIGALLEDGIGDTIRVSLTEDSVNEIPVCQEIVRPYHVPVNLRQTSLMIPFSISEKRNPFAYSRRKTSEVRLGDLSIGGENTICVEIPVLMSRNGQGAEAIRAITSRTEIVAEVIQLEARNPEDCCQAGELIAQFPSDLFSVNIGFQPGLLDAVSTCRLHKLIFEASNAWSAAHFQKLARQAQQNDFAVQCNAPVGQFKKLKEFLAAAMRENLARILVGIGFESGVSPLVAHRMLAAFLDSENSPFPIHLQEMGSHRSDLESLIETSKLFGALLCDGIGDSVQVGDGSHPVAATQLAYNILQATGNRITKTEYVSCPSCGRTLFHLQTVTDRIKKRTAHLKGVKIGIMGCIVNGPGEMADADFGYVGGAPGKVNLYVGRECVQYHVPEDEAEQRLIELIKSRGKWHEPPAP